MASLWLIVGKKQSANKLFTLVSFIGWFLRNAAASFLSSLQSHKMVLSLGSHCFIHLLQTFFLHSLPLFFPCLLTTFLFCAGFRLAQTKGLSARLQMASGLKPHANHGRRKTMVVEKKYDSDLILQLAMAAYWWNIVPQGQIWLPVLFLSFIFITV